MTDRDCVRWAKSCGAFIALLVFHKSMYVINDLLQNKILHIDNHIINSFSRRNHRQYIFIRADFAVDYNRLV